MGHLSDFSCLNFGEARVSGDNANRRVLTHSSALERASFQ